MKLRAEVIRLGNLLMIRTHDDLSENGCGWSRERNNNQDRDENILHHDQA